MGNYLQPIASWAQAVLEERERNTMMSLYRTPFVVMSSAAFVTKASNLKQGKDMYSFGGMGVPSPIKPYSANAPYEERVSEIIKNPPPSGTGTYKGCIISNNVNDLELSYSLNQSIVGIDFDGKHIVVEGETGRKISTPIIVSVDIDSEEANNTIKTTRVGVKCFSLKQLEMFEMFFMKPGMSVLVEWGDSSLLKRGFFKPDYKLEYFDTDINSDKTITPYTDISEALFIKQYSDWKSYCENFSNVFVPSAKSLKKILKNIRQSIGSYDFAAGKISDYSYSISEDGTYDVTLTIYQMNQVSLALPVKPTVNRSSSKPQTPPKQQKDQPITDAIIIDKIISDFSLDNSYRTEIKKYEKGHWFNFDKINKEQKDTLFSSEPYVSLEFILKCLVNISIEDGDTKFVFCLPEYKKLDANDKPIGNAENIIPFHWDKYLISSNEHIIFPSKELPTFELNDPNNPKEIVIANKKTIDGSIFDKSMRLKDSYVLSGNLSNTQTTKKDKNTGNALNCFIQYKKLVEIWSKSITRVQFIKSVLDIINSNSYGIMNLVLHPPQDGAPISVICSRYSPEGVKPHPAPYRFKPTTINSMVKNFTYTFQMDNIIAGKTFFNSGAKLRQAFEKANGNTKNQDKISKGALEFPSDSYRTFEFSMYENADEYFSINWAEKMAQEKIWQEYQNKSKSQAAPTGEYNATNTKSTKEPPTPYADILRANSIKFKTNTKQKDGVTFIYRDKSLIQDKIDIVKKTGIRSLLTNISISITIDGFSGLRAGEIFHLDGVPEVYNKLGAFQIKNIKHNITPEDGWSTTIEADWRIGVNNK